MDCFSQFLHRSTGTQCIVLDAIPRSTGTYWCFNLDTHEHFYTGINSMSDLRWDLQNRQGTIEVLQVRAYAGCARSMCWLGCWFADKNVPKSTWYFIAAIRRTPDNLRKGLTSLFQDTLSAKGATTGTLDLRFTADITEFNQLFFGGSFLASDKIVLGDWQQAILEAQFAQEHAWHGPPDESLRRTWAFYAQLESSSFGSHNSTQDLITQGNRDDQGRISP